MLFVAAAPAMAQNKNGYIDMNRLILDMPEYKKADTTLAEYQLALNQTYADMVKEFNMKDSLLSSVDTLKYNRSTLEIKRKELAQLYLKLQGWNRQADDMYNTKQAQLMDPVQDKAYKAVEAVAKENGYGYVFSRQALVVNPPPADDLMPLVKKKLGIK